MRLTNSKAIKELLGLDDQRVYVVAREPERFGLPRQAIVRIGRQVRWNVDLVEEWIANGGTATNGNDQRGIAA